MRIIFAVILMISLAIPGETDEEVSPSPYIVTSFEGRYCFKMIPNPDAPNDLETGTGYAYRVTNQKNDAILWSTKGWFAFQVYLSGDGKYLVRIGNWPRGRGPSEKHLAIAFYEDGKEIKSYNTQQIIQDKSHVSPSTSHYRFFKGDPGFIEGHGYQFRLVSVDNLEYIFDVRTGTIETVRKL